MSLVTLPRETPPHVARVLHLLSSVRRTARGWSACCPAHDDDHPSLALAVGRGDRLLLHCRAGCRPEEILAVLGLQWAHLFAEGAASISKFIHGDSPLVEARREVLAEARRQPWTRASDLYLAADALRLADRVARSVKVETDDAWELLSMTAALATEAEALWAQAC